VSEQIAPWALCFPGAQLQSKVLQHKHAPTFQNYCCCYFCLASWMHMWRDAMSCADPRLLRLRGLHRRPQHSVDGGQHSVRPLAVRHKRAGDLQSLHACTQGCEEEKQSRSCSELHPQNQPNCVKLTLLRYFSFEYRFCMRQHVTYPSSRAFACFWVLKRHSKRCILNTHVRASILDSIDSGNVLLPGHS
jgi:hypothetical protein